MISVERVPLFYSVYGMRWAGPKMFRQAMELLLVME